MNRVPSPVLILQRWDPGKRAVRGGVALEFPAVPQKESSGPPNGHPRPAPAPRNPGATRRVLTTPSLLQDVHMVARLLQPHRMS